MLHQHILPLIDDKIVVMPVLKIKTARDRVVTDRTDVYQLLYVREQTSNSVDDPINSGNDTEHIFVTIVHPDNYVKYAMRNVNSQWMAAKLSGYICTLSGVRIPVELETGS